MGQVLGIKSWGKRDYKWEQLKGFQVGPKRLKMGARRFEIGGEITNWGKRNFSLGQGYKLGQRLQIDAEHK